MHIGKKQPMFYLGNALIALSFFMLSVIYLPIILLYVGLIPSVNKGNFSNDTYFISIEKIHAAAPIYFDVNPWDKTLYKEILSKGVAHALNTAKPSEKGTMYLFAHSSGLPWQITRENTAFFKLYQLSTNDKIVIANKNNKFIYYVTDKKIVSPWVVSTLSIESGHDLILQTCWPIGTDWQRLLIFASLSPEYSKPTTTQL